MTETQLLLLMLANKGVHENMIFRRFDSSCEQLSKGGYWHWSEGLKRYVPTDKGVIAIDKAVEGARGT